MECSSPASTLQWIALGADEDDRMSRREPRLARARPGRLLPTVLLALSLAGVDPAVAIDLEIGEFTGSLDTTVSVGASMRVEDRECDLVYQGHGGCSADPFWINADDGNLNYDQWNFYSAAVKATTELEISRDNLGAFVRATAFYDAVANDRDPQRTDLDRDARYRTSPINSGVVGLGFLLLDAYLFGDFELGERLLQARAGNQVVSWGESLFTPGGIAQTNAFDVTRLRVPGSELKEAFVPAPMAWVSLDLSASLGLEAYYQVYWNRTQIDPTGSYFQRASSSPGAIRCRTRASPPIPAARGSPPSSCSRPNAGFRAAGTRSRMITARGAWRCATTPRRFGASSGSTTCASTARLRRSASRASSPTR
jgi:hypothetical protein